MRVTTERPNHIAPLTVASLTISLVLLAATSVTADEDEKFERAKQDFVTQELRRAVTSQLMAPVLIRADDLSRFLDLSAEDRYRLNVASKGAASAVADEFRVPTVLMTRQPWKDIDEFSVNGDTIQFPEHLRPEKKPIAPMVPVVKVTVEGTNIRLHVNYGRTGIGTSVAGGMDGVFAHQLFQRTSSDLVTKEQMEEFEEYRTKRMRKAITEFLGASLDVHLTLRDDQKEAVRRWLEKSTTDVAANPNNQVSQNAYFLIRQIKEDPLEEILTEDQLELWRATRPLLEQKRW